MEIKKLLYKLSCGFTFLPIYLAVNITNVCNRKCNFCPYHSQYLNDSEHDRWFRKQPDELQYDRFYALIRRLGIFRKWVRHIAITGKGEPFISRCIGMYAYVCNLYHIRFSITTNGDYLKSKTLAELFEYKYLTGIRISIYDEKSYHKIVRLVTPFLDSRITLFDQTGLGLEGTIPGYAVQNPGTEDFCTMEKDFNKATWCKAPFSFLTINTDGSVVPCYSYHEIGKISDPIWKLYNGKEIRKYRRYALSMQCTMSDCKNCGINLK